MPALAGCSGGGGKKGKGLDDFLPPIPEPDGTAQSTWAGQITAQNTGELIDGQASSGLVGDYYMRNSKVRIVIQSPNRVIGVVPYGGNVIDAVALDESGNDVSDDHFGELSMLYVAGRTCAHDSIEVVRDGSGGGVAAIRARGKAAVNDFFNLQGTGIFSLPGEIDPDIEDGVECATTYILRPDSNRLEVAWTLFNGGEFEVRGPLAAFADTGGEVGTFAPGLGYYRLSFSDIGSVAGDSSAPYSVIQGPGVAYGTIPRFEDTTTPNAMVNLLGVSVVILGSTNLLDILNEQFWYLRLPVADGVNQWVDFVVTRDAAGVEAAYQELTGGATTEVTGSVSFAPSGDPAPARVGVYRDSNSNGMLDGDDKVVTFFDCLPDGTFSGAIPAGDYLIRADIADTARSAVSPLSVSGASVSAGNLTLDDAAVFDVEVVDDDTGNPIPARLTIVGRHPVPLDGRVQDTNERRFGLLGVRHLAYGTSMAATMADPADPPLVLPAGGPYRVFASRGTEWSLDSVQVSPSPGETGTLQFRLKRVVDTGGYIASEYHVHSIGSPDSIIPFEERLRSMVSEGIELFASTDHDYVADYDPYIDLMGLRGWIDAIPGVESTPFAWGHFISYPLVPDPMDPSRGAVDWATGMVEGLDMLPDELWGALRQRGGEVIQVNHPRSLSFGFMQFFDVVALEFDFDGRSFGGDPAAMPVPANWIRQPEQADIFSPEFDSLEVWNGFSVKDSDGDGRTEIQSLDLVLRDWMNFLSFGKVVAPMGNSDTHTREKDPGGMPRTLVRVPDDSAAALTIGLEDDVYATIRGTTPMDIVVTNGPMLRVSADGGATSALGQTLAPGPGTAVTLDIHAESPDWISFDTIEVFANATFDPVQDERTALSPLVCFTTRSAASLDPADPCALAPLGVRPMSVVKDPQGGGYSRLVADVALDLAAGDIVNRAGAQGEDAWIVVRVSGQDAVFPLLPGALTDQNLDAVVAAADPDALIAAVAGQGVPAAAFTSPIFIDFDGGGYRAPFGP